MRALLLTVALSFVASNLQAQTCTPEPVEFLAWGPQGEGGQIVWGNAVPTGEVWSIHTAGIATFDGRYFDWMLQKQSNGHFHPVDRSWAAATPVLAYTGKPIVMVAGEFLGSRVNAPADFGNGHVSGLGMALLYTGFKFPASCLERVLLGPSVLSTMTSAPDFTALIQAAQAAATAMQNLAASVPPH